MTNTLPSRFSFVSYSIVSIILGASTVMCGCSQTPNYALRTKSDFIQASISLRRDENFDLNSLEKSIQDWFKRDKNRVTFFQDLPSSNVNPSQPANWRDVSLVQDALLSRSLMEAKVGNEKESRRSLLLSTSVSVLALTMPTPNNLTDASGGSLSRKSKALTILSFSGQLKSMQKYMDKYPSSAKSWKWYQTVYDIVSKSRSSNQNLGREAMSLLDITDSNSLQWDSLSSKSARQMTPEFDQITKALIK